MPNQIAQVQEEIRRYCSDKELSCIEGDETKRQSVISKQPLNRLSPIFPMIEALVGKTFFDAMCDAYFSKYVTSVEQAHDRLEGESFDQFLTDFAPLKPLPFFADLASLEWAVFEINQAAGSSNNNGKSRADLAEMPEQPFDYRIQWSPTLRVLELSHNVHHIWQMYQMDALDKVVMHEQKIDLLVWMKDSELLFAELSASEKALFEYLRRTPTVWTFQEKYAEFEQQLSKLIQLKQVVLTL